MQTLTNLLLVGVCFIASTLAIAARTIIHGADYYVLEARHA